MSDTLEDPELMQTPQVPPMTVDYAFSYVGFHGKKGHFTSFVTFHWFKVSRGMVSVPCHFSTTKKKNTDVISGGKATF